MPRRRLFVAVWPPEHVIAQLERLDRPERPGLRWTTRDQWHVTLLFLGSVEEEQEEELRASLSGTDWAAPGPTEATAGPAPAAIGRTVWALAVSGLNTLAAATTTAAAPVVAGGEGSGRVFNGHLTLARAKTPRALRGLPTPPFHAAWHVREVTLVHSTLDPAGARYEIVQTWGLPDPSE